MTVSTELSHEEYVGNGVTTDFDFRFRIFEGKHLIVVVADSDGIETTLKNGTDYTIVGAGSYHGGKVVLNKPLAQGWKILLERDLPVVQETDLRNQGKFFAEVHEDAFDYLTMLIQKSLGTFSLSLRKPTYLSNYYDAKDNRIANLALPKLGTDAANKDYVDNSIKDIDSKTLRVKDKAIPALPNTDERAGKVLTFDENGNPIAVAPSSGSAVDVLNQLGNSSGSSLIGYKYNSLNSIKRTVNNKLDDVCSITDFTSMFGDDVDNTRALQNAARSGVPIYIPHGKVIKISEWSEDLVGIVGKGSIISSVEESYTYNMPDGFFIDGLHFYSTARGGLSLSGNGINIDWLFAKFIGDPTALTRYNPIQFNKCPNMFMSNIRYINSGLRLLACENISLDSFYIDVAQIGIGPDGRNDGTDGIKGSRQTTGNISNGLILNSSRDGIDFYTSGRDLNISNIHISNSYFHGIEIKSYKQDSSPDIPVNININSINISKTGKGIHTSDCAGIFLMSEDVENKKLKRININNLLINDVGNKDSQTGSYHGVVLSGVSDIKISNSNILNVEHGNLSAVSSGVRAVYCDNIDISNSDITASDRGINIINSDNISINSGTSIGNSGGQKSKYGLHISGINSNLFIDSTSSLHGEIKSIESTGSTLTDIKIHGNIKGGATISTVNGLIVENSIIDGSGSIDGLQVTSPGNKNVLIRGNKFKGTGRGAVNLGSTKAAVISNNLIDGFTSPYIDSFNNNGIIIRDNIKSSAVTGDFATPSGDQSASSGNISL
ncbi:hypothetical protein [Proteus terrae]|uniref:hypothetical protein n=1 Tax=Proteus terrae TaxID=1574161 RepID=UPI00301DAD13